MKFVRQFTSPITNIDIAICLNDKGEEVQMTLSHYCSNYYCPITVASQEELDKEVAQYMNRHKVGRRAAIGAMIHTAEDNMLSCAAYGDDNGESEYCAKLDQLVKMRKALPKQQYTKNTLGNLFPELAKLG